MTGRGNGNRLPPISGSAPEERPGKSGDVPQIEGYEIMEELGRGGMGAVWSAVQLSTRRQVALKLLGKGAFSSEKARARFEREVELTGRLEHPNVARIYESGLHHGVHYYAMEFIDGVPLDKYVQDHDLSRRQTLELMETVCEAVQHAHQSGVIHRDLKPSNILVTADGQPHILDFGLAKGFLEGDSILTVSADGEAPGTPAYMSPEQAAGKLDQIDTRSDVYALGVVLFRLLTGESPHDLSGTRYEVMRRIAEEEVRRPREITKDVDRELEALLLKALAHDPKDRYPSAGALAQDIENYLNGEPLTAKPPTAVYFLSKRLKKYRVRVAVAGSVLAALVTMAVYAYVRVSNARDSLQKEVNKASTVGEFMRGVFNWGDPKLTFAQEALDDGAKEAGVMFSDRPEVEAAVRAAIGNAYMFLEQIDPALTQFSRALEIRLRVLGEEHPDTLQSMQMLSAALWNKGRLEDAVAMDRQILSIRERVLGEEHPDTHAAMFNLTFVLIKRGKFDEAEAMGRRCVQAQQKAGVEESRQTFLPMTAFATALYRNRKLDEVEAILWRCFESAKRVQGERHPNTLFWMNNLAFVLEERAKLAEAETLLRRSLEMGQFISKVNDLAVLSPMNHLAVTLWRMGNLDEAEYVNTKILEGRRRVLGERHPDTLGAMSNLSVLLEHRGKVGEAQRLRDEELRIRGAVLVAKRARTWAATWLNTAQTERSLIPGPLVEEADTKRTVGGGGAFTNAGRFAALAREDFNGKLDLDWRVQNPDPSHASLSKKPGSLTITTQDGCLSESNADYENLFIIDCPAVKEEDLQVTTCISSFQPVTEWNQAGLIFYNDDDNYLKFTYEWNNLHGGRLFNVAVEVEVRPAQAKFFLFQETDTIWLRVTKRGNRYRFSTSFDGESFVQENYPVHDFTGRFQHGLAWGDGSVRYIGLVAMNGKASGAPEIDASFDFFEVRSLPAEGEPGGEMASAREKESDAQVP